MPILVACSALYMQLGADLVTLFNDGDSFALGYCGKAGMGAAWNGTGLSPVVVQYNSFSVIQRGCYLGYTLAHELGHNQGCGHSRDMDTYWEGLWATYAWGYRKQVRVGGEAGRLGGLRTRRMDGG